MSKEVGGGGRFDIFLDSGWQHPCIALILGNNLERQTVLHNGTNFKGIHDYRKE